jgi:hypothetical protein
VVRLAPNPAPARLACRAAAFVFDNADAVNRSLSYLENNVNLLCKISAKY